MKKSMRDLKNEWIVKARTEARYRAFFTALGYRVNYVGIQIMALSRSCVRFINHHITDQDNDRFVTKLPALQKQVGEILKRQRRDYAHYSYFDGYPYQSLGILGIYGERGSEERFDLYGLADLVKPDDVVLDIGCNCGFMALLTSYRTGAKTHGIDINPYMIEIGQACTDFLKLQDKVKLEPGKFQDMEGHASYDVVYSFATHWTDDGNYRIALHDHMMKIYRFLKTGGLLVFETHCADVGDENFYNTMSELRSSFSWNEKRTTDNGQRELYLMRKL